ncbi:Phage gp6-like head-tail connector protein [Halobacillus karajensis]|uniref:Phage gp6-like head-tail connector protein n=1 Tax=Halobacillus karajensis TaxID=195088 RepID=A0A024P5S7_9BACI|nr:phage head-tail connector protein [Halobacillus karajensis]CDQ20858.1 Phage gp6-like head-tail connector protein [Halobacillus karajensis]CDQ23672.1 Phage gp6-like head-tail connector protein [Halobacillus karajensis]CDQ27150.1 Phage gp6-like head-tail connector protein [Halobacillus karajensis]SEI03620.1 Phage gp6-like head-tail connector protein [Halobacillus karajensis]
MATTKDNVKTVLGLQDNLQDNVIDIIIRNIESRLTVWFKQHTDLTTIPDELQFIVEEMAVNRFNRIGSEGMESESVEGRSVSFKEDDFKPYLNILESYIPKQDGSGKVMFF